MFLDGADDDDDGTMQEKETGCKERGGRMQKSKAAEQSKRNGKMQNARASEKQKLNEQEAEEQAGCERSSDCHHRPGNNRHHRQSRHREWIRRTRIGRSGPRSAHDILRRYSRRANLLMNPRKRHLS